MKKRRKRKNTKVRGLFLCSLSVLAILFFIYALESCNRAPSGNQQAETGILNEGIQGEESRFKDGGAWEEPEQENSSRSPRTEVTKPQEQGSEPQDPNSQEQDSKSQADEYLTQMSLEEKVGFLPVDVTAKR